MVETITPVVHGGPARWMIGVVLHVVGAGATSAMFGAALGGLGLALGAPFGIAGSLTVAMLAVLYAIGELKPGLLPVPQLRRQVPDWWRTFFPAPIAALLYGAGLGMGFLTYLRHGTLVAVSALVFSSGRPAFGAVVMSAFGVARGFSVVRAAGVRTAEDGRRLVDSLGRALEGVRRLANGAALLLLGASVLAAPRISAGGGWQRLAAASLALIFAWSAGSKVVAGRRWARTISDHRLPLSIQRVARVGVPFIEAVVPSLVIVGFHRAAAWWALLTLIGFSLELIRVRRPGTSAVPCGCFGGRRSVDLRAALARNATIGAIAAVATVATAHGWSPRLGWPDSPRSEAILPMVLASVGMAVAGLTAWRASVWVRRAARV
jgi:hypothetical protein